MVIIALSSFADAAQADAPNEAMPSPQMLLKRQDSKKRI